MSQSFNTAKNASMVADAGVKSSTSMMKMLPKISEQVLENLGDYVNTSKK